jgi:hypothetical protein
LTATIARWRTTLAKQVQNPRTWERAFIIVGSLAACAAAYYTRQQWLTADDQEKRSLRAYLVVTAARFAKDDFGGLKFGLTDREGRHELLIFYDVSNEGVTPAYDVRRLVDVEYPFAGKVEFKYSDGTSAYLTKQHTFGPVRTRYFSDDEIKSILSGTVPLLFAGQITYRDIFGHQWPTNYCFLHAAAPVEASFEFCPRWNDADRLQYAK